MTSELTAPVPAAAASTRSYDYEIVLVTYHSRDLLESFLPAIPEDVPMVVVDNGQGADGIDELVAPRTGTRYLVGPNRGFAAGANLGAATSTAEHLVFVNPDSEPTLDQLDQLVEPLRRDSGLGLVSATTRLPGGSIEIGVGGWEPTVRRALVHATGLHKIFPRAGLWATPEPGAPLEVDWLGGAVMACPREVFDRLGAYDEGYFVYSEDVDFGRKLRLAGMRQLLRTDVILPHIGAGSGDARTWMLQMRAGSMVQYLRQNNPRRTTNGIRLALTAGYAGRYVVCRLRHRDAVAAEHAAYIRGLWVGTPATP
ncbi:MAG: glycosyltransferase family 2 protein [Pseudonocardia sp.]|nr:glycosyltransferase family 2 protein [Pseudonocardia sp.]